MAILILLFPVVAYANSPVPSPYDIDIAIYDYSKVSGIDIYGSIDGDQYEFITTAWQTTETRRENEKIVDFYNNEGTYKSFKLVVELKNGEQVQSNPVDLVEWGEYTYDVEKNILAQGEITNVKKGFGGAFTLLILPLAITLVVEWLISLAFKLKPSQYVIIANLITNPIMNLFIIILFNNFMMNYWVILLLLEIAVAVFEYFYYVSRYKQFSVRRLLLFTVTANIASWGLYYLFGNHWF